MRIGIIETGKPPNKLRPQFGSYSNMIQNAFGKEFDFTSYDAQAFQVPGTAEVDAVVISGSPAGVHDGHEWIGYLRTWIINSSSSLPLVGICFGHQLMADAFGGLVRTATRWGVGIERYDLVDNALWGDEGGPVALPASHRDQVVRAPANATVTATADYCPIAALRYVDRKALSIQPHPEFTKEFVSELVTWRAEQGTLSAAEISQARSTLRRSKHDGPKLFESVTRFLRNV